MINANELRIGNYIKFKGSIISISAKGLYDLAYSNDYTGMHEPIKLEPEILEKAGFNNYGSYYSHVNLELSRAESIYGGEIIVVPSKKYALELKYVHQLQNLYFALTGEELEITL